MDFVTIRIGPTGIVYYFFPEHFSISSVDLTILNLNLSSKDTTREKFRTRVSRVHLEEVHLCSLLFSGFN